MGLARPIRPPGSATSDVLPLFYVIALNANYQRSKLGYIQ